LGFPWKKLRCNAGATAETENPVRRSG